MNHPIAVGAAASIASAILGVAFSDTVTLGSLILGALVALTVGYFQIREKIGSSWRDEATAQKERGDRLQREKDDLLASQTALRSEMVETRHALELQIAELKARPDMTTLRTDFQEASERAMTRFEAHDERVADLLARVVSSLDRVTGRAESLMAEHWKLLGLVAATSSGASEAAPMAERIVREHEE